MLTSMVAGLRKDGGFDTISEHPQAHLSSTQFPAHEACLLRIFDFISHLIRPSTSIFVQSSLLY